MRRFFQLNGWRYIPGTILLIMCAFIQTRAPQALGRAIELSVNGDYVRFARETWSILWIALGVFVTRFGWRYFIIGTSRELEIYLRDRLFDHLCYLPLRFYGQNRSGDLMAYAINDVGAVRMMFGVVVAQLLNAVTSIGFSVNEMAAGVNPRLTLVALLPVPFAMAAVLFIGRNIQVRSRRVQELFASVSGHVQENINGMRVLKAFAQERAQYEAFEKESNDKRIANTRLYDAGALLQPAIQLIFGLSYVIGLAYGGQLVLDGEIGLGAYVAFNIYLTLIIGPVAAVGRMANQLQRGMASYKRLDALMGEPETDPFDRRPDDQPISGALEAKSLHFQYEGAATPAIDDVSFSIPAGGVLGIAGPTGSGKSTLMMLLVKLLIPERGQLFIDGRDLCDIPAASIRSAIGYVPQDGFLFNESIRTNVDFFSGASEEEILSAIRAAGLEADIEAMPEGLDTPAGERGNHLSGGQRQRASLARALLRKPAILLLDDTLSAVDAHTEAQILQALKGQLSGRTAVIVSHKLSALKHADQILYMDNGHVVERGSHDELMAHGGAYAEVYNAQMEEAQP